MKLLIECRLVIRIIFNTSNPGGIFAIEKEKLLGSLRHLILIFWMQ